MMKPILLLTLASLCILPPFPAVGAEQANGCHCFRNRDYNPSDKFGADDYLLATSFNSLIAATLGVSKRQIVMMKMKGGINPEELLIALYVAQAAGSDVDLLLSVRANGGSWQSIVTTPAIQKHSGTDPVLTALAGGALSKEISRQIADFMIQAQYKTSKDTLLKLHEQGFSDKEVGLIIALHNQKNAPVEQLAAMAGEKKMSWSEIAHSLNLTPSSVGKNILNSQQTNH